MKTRKRIVLLTTKYPLDSASSWLSSDLAEYLVLSGWSVIVLFLDWNSLESNYSRPLYKKNGVVILCQKPVNFQRLIFSNIFKWSLSSIFAYYSFYKLLRKKKYEGIIAFSPAVTVWFLVLTLIRKSRKSALLYWDFFPVHQIQIGLIADGIFARFLFLFERFIVKKFDFVGCMSRQNMVYFSNYFSVCIDSINEVPLWASSSHKDIDFNVYDNSIFRTKGTVRCVFGGQLTAGRGVSFLAQIIHVINKNCLPIKITVIGSGSEENIIDAAIQSAPGIAERIPSISRDKYLLQLKRFDVGLIMTVGGVDVPTYPSKIIDYTSVGLPVVAAVEAESDFPHYVKYYNAGICTAVDDVDGFIAAILRLSDNALWCSCSAGALRMFRERHSQHSALQALFKYLKEDRQ